MGSDQSRQAVEHTVIGLLNVIPDIPDFRDFQIGENGKIANISKNSNISSQNGNLSQGGKEGVERFEVPHSMIDWRVEYDVSPMYQTTPYGDSVSCSICSLLYPSWKSSYRQKSSISRRWIHTLVLQCLQGNDSQQLELQMGGGNSFPISIRHVLKQIRNIGLVSENECPSPDLSLWLNPPSLTMRQKAYNWTIDYRRIHPGDIITNLLQKRMILTAVSVFSNFLRPEVRTSGYLPTPDSKIDSLLGMMSIVIVGFHPSTNRWIVRFHLGNLWGDHGYGYLDRDYLYRHACDFWILSLVPRADEAHPQSIIPLEQLFVDEQQARSVSDESSKGGESGGQVRDARLEKMKETQEIVDEAESQEQHDWMLGRRAI